MEVHFLEEPLNIFTDGLRWLWLVLLPTLARLPDNSLILNKVVRDEIVHKVQMVKTNIEERSTYITDLLRSGGRLTFWDLCKEAPSRMVVIVTFLAVLEMVKDQRLELYVSEDSTAFIVSLPSAAKVIS